MINLNQKKQRFLITGGTGFIGSHLVKEILKDGHTVTVLTRNLKLLAHNNEINYICTLDENNFNFDIVINLCGAPISRRWNARIKKEIYNSRIKITQEIARIIHLVKNPPKLVISGSAIGYYGLSQNEIFDEKKEITNQHLFSQEICLAWEGSAQKISQKTRLVIVRLGVVLGKNGGILKKMLLPFKLGLGGKIGKGDQHLSWIHIQDVIGIINFVINNQNISGAINLVSPHVTSNEIFSKTLATKLHRPCIFNMPSTIAKLLFGQMANELLLHGQHVYPKIILDSGYQFKFKDLKSTISDIVV